MQRRRIYCLLLVKNHSFTLFCFAFLQLNTLANAFCLASAKAPISVYIYVLDENDCPPEFQGTPYIASIQEVFFNSLFFGSFIADL